MRNSEKRCGRKKSRPTGAPAAARRSRARRPRRAAELPRGGWWKTNRGSAGGGRACCCNWAISPTRWCMPDPWPRRAPVWPTSRSRWRWWTWACRTAAASI
ncbi:hypothetical protein G6F40_016681 [Rhizopus arrhizus]|nr:hypothetical protein G6F40_016681 [Rhizopus arrhizus]